MCDVHEVCTSNWDALQEPIRFCPLKHSYTRMGCRDRVQVTPEQVLCRLLEMEPRKLDQMPNTVCVVSVAISTISIFGDREAKLPEHLEEAGDCREKVFKAFTLLKDHWNDQDLEAKSMNFTGESIPFTPDRILCMECNSFM